MYSFREACLFPLSPQVRQIHQIDQDLDHLDIHLPLWDVVRDLYTTDPTQETCPRSCRLCGSRPATWATSRQTRNKPALPGRSHHDVRIDLLSEVWFSPKDLSVTLSPCCCRRILGLWCPLCSFVPTLHVFFFLYLALCFLNFARSCLLRSKV